MKTLELTTLVAGAIHIRGIVGSVSVVDRPVGTSHKFRLDPTKTVPGKRAVVQYRAGVLQADDIPDDLYNEMQIFCTPRFEAGRRLVLSDGVRDESGNKIKDASLKKDMKIGLEIDSTSVLAGPNIFLGWRVDYLGRMRLTASGDGKPLRSIEFTAVVSKDQKRDGSVKLSRVHLATAGLKVAPGDVVAIPFMFSELSTIKGIKVDVKEY
jgi:hypothetical protein